MALGSQQRRERLVADVRELLEEVRGCAECADARIGMVMFFSISWDKKRKKNDRKMVI
jgi:hypothetical protein